MTSGVKQALPQVLMPKTGAEGKATRNRVPQSDFAEALGLSKAGKQPERADAGADRLDSRAAWPRLASRFDSAIDRADAAKPGAVSSAKSEEEQAEDKPAIRKDDAEAISQPQARQTADATQAPSSPAASSPVLAGATEPRRQAAVPRKEPPVPAGPDAIADGLETSPSPSLAAARKPDSAAPVFVPMGRGGEAEPIGFEPAAGSATAPPDQMSADRAQAKDALPEAPAEPAKTTPRATLLAQQSIPAPMPSTALVLVKSLAASDLLEPARNAPVLDAIHLSATHASAQSLKIQLHPAELGMVTATLRFAGEQLSIELQVENHEAYRHLSGDSDTIVSSLRDLGYEVDRVTILQPQLASTPAGRSDASSSMPSPQGRAPDQFGSGAPGAGNGGSGGRQPSDGGNGGRSGQPHPQAAREQQGSGLYI